MQKVKVCTPLRYPGGKSRVIKKYIQPMIPKYEGDFFEPFVGGGSVALYQAQLHPDKKIYINDLNYNLCCFWRVLQKQSEVLVKDLHYVRARYEEDDVEQGKKLLQNMKAFLEGNEYERAIAFFVLNKISFSGLTEHSSLSKQAYKSTFNHGNIDKLAFISSLMKKFSIHNEHYIDFFEKVSDDDFSFLDPPYDIGEKLYGKKGELHKGFDHQEFADAMKSLKGQWMITYNDNERIRNRFQNYNIYDREYRYCMSFSTDKDGQKHTRLKNELIIINYKL